MPITDTATLIISAKADSARVDEFTKAVDRADEHSKELIKTLGGLLSTGMMVNFGRQAISTFSDLQESTQKFYEVFKGLDKEAGLAAENLEKSFGASQRSAKSMLSLTGDLLTGFGFSREEALKLSIQVAQLGSDIASFANYSGGAEGAAVAITKAMLGETEMAKMLGIAIKTDSKEFQELMKSIKETRGVTDAQAKALAALQTAFEQKKTAMGDFERNINSIANRGRMLSNELEDLKANIGRGLSEGFSEGQAAGIRLLKLFNDLSPEAQDFITKTGAIATGLFAVKTAMSTYTAIQGISSALTAKNTTGTLAEADAHIKNAQAIQAENMARSGGVTATVAANPLFDIGKQIKANKKETLFAKHDLQQANLAGDLKEIEKAKQAYRSLLVERRKLYQNLGIEQANQGVAQFNANLVGTNQRMAQVGNQFGRFQKQMTTFPTLAKGANALRSGIAGIATGAKVATGAVWGLTKAFLPMLAVSAAIAGIDYLINRSKKAAQAQNELAEALYKSSQSRADKVYEQIRAEKEQMKTLETLSKYSKLTNEEQITATDIISKLSGKYTGLGNELKIVNDRLVIGAKAFSNLTEEQRKNYVQQEKRNQMMAMNKVNSMVQGFSKEFGLNFLDKQLTDTSGFFNNYRDWFSGLDSILGTKVVENAANKKMIEQMVNRGGKAGYYEGIANLARQSGLKDMAERADQIAAALRQAELHKKNIDEANKQNKPLTGDVKQNVSKLTKEEEKKFSSFVKNLQDKRFDILFDMASEKEKLSMIEKEILKFTNKRDAALERSKDDRKQAIKAQEYSLKLIDLEKQKSEIMKRADADRVSKMEEQKRKLDEQIAVEKQFAMSLYQTNMKFREAAVTPTSSNSLDAIRLQSRSFLGSGNALQNLQKQTADSAKKSAEAAKRSNEIQEQMKNKLNEIFSKLEKIGVSTVG